MFDRVFQLQTHTHKDKHKDANKGSHKDRHKHKEIHKDIHALPDLKYSWRILRDRMYFVILFMRVKIQYCTQTHLILKHDLETISKIF